MSQWRRVALEEVPSCKRVIEEAAGPVELWFELWQLWREFFSAYGDPSDAEKMRQIYQFALQCSQGEKSNPMTRAVGQFFFYYIVGQFVVGDREIRLDLPKRMSSSDFEYWLKTVESDFPEETLNAAKKTFNAAKHK